jgi:hypothetical protein
MANEKQLIEGILKASSPISLNEMDEVALQNRIDRKYIFHYSKLAGILLQLLNDYYVLDIDANRIFSYKTVYYDTPDFQFYKDHHNGLTNRVKVRCRQYIETNNTFFEIKRKYQGTRTDKFRFPIEVILPKLGENEYNVVKDSYKKKDIDELVVTLTNFFYRITLVNKKQIERATIDFCISFQSSDSDAEAKLTDIVIIEVKQGKMDDSSPIVQLLKKEKISSGSISKYSYGLMVTHDQVKYNSFKPLLQKVYKIQNNGIIRQSPR